MRRTDTQPSTGGAIRVRSVISAMTQGAFGWGRHAAATRHAARIDPRKSWLSPSFGSRPERIGMTSHPFRGSAAKPPEPRPCMTEPGRSNVIGVEHTTPMTHCQCEVEFLHAC